MNFKVGDKVEDSTYPYLTYTVKKVEEDRVYISETYWIKASSLTLCEPVSSVKVDLSYKCRCPKANFALNGVGCECGGI